MANKTLFVHIGTEKTGTSALQQFLTLNSDQLSVQGFGYPSEPEGVYFQNNGHFPIVASLVADSVEFISAEKKIGMSRAVADFVEVASRSPLSNFIISAEQFSSRVLDVAVLTDLKHQLSLVFNEIFIVCYLRDQASWAISSFSTNVVGGRREPFSSMEVTVENCYFNQVEMLDRWSAVFGKDNVIAREYARERFHDGDICRDFCQVLGIDFSKLQQSEEVNRSRGAVELEAIRLLNQTIPTFFEDESAWQEARSFLDGFIVPRLALGDDSAPKLSDHERCVILNRFRAHNERLCAEYLKQHSRENWFVDEESVPAEVVDCYPSSEVKDKAVEAVSRALLSVSRELFGVWLEREAYREKLERLKQEILS